MEFNMPKVALITLHGMGTTGLEQDPPAINYADPLKEKLKQALGSAYDELTIRPVYYQQLLQANEADYWGQVVVASKVRYDKLREFMLFGFGDAAGLETRKQDENSVYELAQREIARALLYVYKQCGSDCNVVFLTHSLGCQVLSNYIYDGQKYKQGGPVDAGIWSNIARTRETLGLDNPDMEGFLRAETCMAWVTMGCNIPIFVASHKREDIRPIKRPNNSPTFRWLNLYDPDDVLGWPLQPLSDGYEELVEDRAINAGQGVKDLLLKSWNPVSHTAYWTDNDVVNPLADMLRNLLR
jgi:hypothetical protein